MIRTTDIPDLEGYGVFIDGIDFKQLTRGEWRELGKLYMNKLVMIIRKSGLKNKNNLDLPLKQRYKNKIIEIVSPERILNLSGDNANIIIKRALIRSPNLSTIVINKPICRGYPNLLYSHKPLMASPLLAVAAISDNAGK